MTPEEMRRLSLIRLLLLGAEENSQQAPPFNTDSINRLHDVAEMFLALAVEHCQGSIPRDFMAYWEELERRTGQSLAYRAAMQRVNRTRVNLKHYGVQPDASEVAHCVSTVHNLIIDETPRLFGVKLEEATLARFVTGDRPARCIETAEDHWRAGLHAEAMADLHEAFVEILGAHEGRMNPDDEHGLTDLLRPIRSFQRELRMTRGSEKAGGHPRQERHERRLWDALQVVLEDLDERLTLLGLNIDQTAHARFVNLTPTVRLMGDSEHRFWAVDAADTWTDEEYLFCRDFVIATSLQLANINTVKGASVRMGSGVWRQMRDLSAAVGPTDVQESQSGTGT